MQPWYLWRLCLQYESNLQPQPWIFIGRTDAEAEAPFLWTPDVKSWLTGKDLDAGKDWGQEENGATEDETVGWHHWINGHEFEQTPEDSEGKGKPVVLQSMGLQKVRQLNDWTTIIYESFASPLLVMECFVFSGEEATEKWGKDKDNRRWSMKKRLKWWRRMQECGKQKTDLGYDLTQSSNLRLLNTNFEILQDCTRSLWTMCTFEQVEDRRRWTWSR